MLFASIPTIPHRSVIFVIDYLRKPYGHAFFISPTLIDVMVDPAGIAVGGASLTIQLLDGCVKGSRVRSACRKCLHE